MEVLELEDSLERLNGRLEKNSALWHRQSLTQNGLQSKYNIILIFK